MKFFVKPIITKYWEQIDGDTYAAYMRELQAPESVTYYEGWAFAVVNPEAVAA